jgi:hypothetical protein
MHRVPQLVKHLKHLDKLTLFIVSRDLAALIPPEIDSRFSPGRWRTNRLPVRWARIGIDQKNERKKQISRLWRTARISTTHDDEQRKPTTLVRPSMRLRGIYLLTGD